MLKFTEVDFERLSFHDNLMRGFRIVSGPGERTDIVLDIDYIKEWARAGDCYEFLVAAADLTFHGVTGLKLSMDWHDEKFQVCSAGDWIINVQRSQIVPQLVYLDQQYWRWEFTFAMETELTFGAYGFTLQLRQEPIRQKEQSLPMDLRM